MASAWDHVREPSPTEAESFAASGTLLAIVAWAGLKGDPTDGRSQAGSLFALTGIIEDGEFISVAEAGSMDPEGIDAVMTGWTYEDGDGRSVNPNIAVQGRARSFFRAAAITAGTCWSRLAQQDYESWQYRQMHTGAGSSAIASSGMELSSATASAMELVTSRAEKVADAKKNHVSLNKTVDITKERSVPLMTSVEYNVCWNRFKKKMDRAPFPHEKPSVHQLTAVRDILRNEGCYADFCLMGPNHVRTMKAWKYLAQIMVAGVVQESEMKGPRISRCGKSVGGYTRHV